MDAFSGTLNYEASFTVQTEDNCRYLLDLGEVHETAHLYVNGHDAGVKMWAPYILDITHWIRDGLNTVRVEVTNSIANRISRAKLESGLFGPVSLVKIYEQ